jgi:glycosyltransferase involved in cell wall biosynthesis
MSLIEKVFWLSCFTLLYTVVLYPLLLIVISLFARKEIVRDDQARKVALVVPVHNGENEIEAKIKNCLALDYPRDMLEIYFVSDGSTDRTVDIVHSYHEDGIYCMALTERVGKVPAQNAVLSKIKAEIIVFSDVGILIPASALKDIVSNFADPSIGAVSCRDEVVSHKKSQGDSLYINYDMLIRSYTSMIGSLIGVTGGFYAVRREIAEGGWEPVFPPDFYVALKAIRMGFRVIEDNRVIARYHASKSDIWELDRKVRSITRGIWALYGNIALLNPFRFPMISFQLISHKVLRWMTPLFFLICLMTSCLLAFENNPFYNVVFFLQLLFYGWGGAIYLLNLKGIWTGGFSSLPKLFLMFNFAILLSWKNFFTGRKIVQWQPTVRSSGAE